MRVDPPDKFYDSIQRRRFHLIVDISVRTDYVAVKNAVERRRGRCWCNLVRDLLMPYLVRQ